MSTTGNHEEGSNSRESKEEEKIFVASKYLEGDFEEINEEEEEDDDDESSEMSLVEHLQELRKRILYIIIWTVIGFIPCYAYGTKLFYYLKLPLINVLPEGSDIIFTGLPDGFFTEMQIGLIAGLFLVSPMIFYQLWAFIAPGLYKEEKVFLLPIAFFSGLFFIIGGAFCYFITFPVAFKFFLTYNSEHMRAMLSATEYMSFSLHLLFAFGIIFELPLVVFFLSRIGIISANWLKKMRRYAILAIVIVAAILSPPDVLSQLLMCIPMLVLYEVSILVAVVFGKNNNEEKEI